MKPITRNGAEKLAAKHGAALVAGQLEIDGDQIMIWHRGTAEGADTFEHRDAAEASAVAIGAELEASVFSNGYKDWINYRRAPVDRGDPGDPSSMHHY